MPTPTTTVRLPAELSERLARQAQAARKTRSAIVIEALNEYLQRRGQRLTRAQINRELKRLDKHDRASPEERDYYREAPDDPWDDEA